MEKSFIVIALCFFTSLSVSQDSLCVFKVSPDVLGKLNDIKKPLQKGDFLNRKSTVYLTSPSEVTFINSRGDAFILEDIGAYTYKNILGYKALDEQKSLTSKYFKLIWDELLKRDSGKTIIGGVFRGDILMEFPKDSTKMSSSKLTFKWLKNEGVSQYYMFIRNPETEEVFKFATNGSELILYKDNPVFNGGEEFEWTVSTSEFPNLKNIPFYRITLIDRAEYERIKSGFDDLISDLKELGLSSLEIEETLCITYGICK